MAYQICISKTSPCCVNSFIVNCTIVAIGQSARTLEVYGCSYDRTQGETSTGQGVSPSGCTQGTYMPVGSCCAWTVPTAVTTIYVDIWGSGGGGGSTNAATCCGINPGAGAGTYVRKKLTVTPGAVLTICAGAAGCGGPNSHNAATTGVTNYCCCGGRGACSFIKNSGGTVLVDAYGGSQGTACCYISCGCTYTTTIGAVAETAFPQGSNGSNSGCTSVAVDMIGGPGVVLVPGCVSGPGQMAFGGAATFGGDNNFWGYHSNPQNQYLRWNTACTNSAGVAGPGGDPVSPSLAASAFNTPGSTNYAVSTDGYIYCGRYQSAPMPGNFPGGGGVSGPSSACIAITGSGASGATGYVRIWY